MNESKWYIQRLKGHGKRKFVKALKLNCQGRTLSRDRFVLQRSGKKNRYGQADKHQSARTQLHQTDPFVYIIDNFACLINLSANEKIHYLHL